MNSLFAASPLPVWATSIFLILIGVTVMYAARDTAHQTVKAFLGTISLALKLGSRSLVKARNQLRERNREVLLALGREHAEREIEKEFFEINKFVQRDLGGYPKLQRNMQEQITKIQEDYSQCSEVPVPSPEWVEAVDSVANLKTTDKNPALNAKILEEINKSAQQQHKEVLSEYRNDISTRHQLLKGMTPYWRKLSNSIDETGTRLKDLVTRSQSIDAQMNNYREIVSGTPRAERMLKASALTQFIIASLVITFAIGGAFFNFHLIALPMSEMVGAVNRVGGIKVADLAALVIICVEVTAGIFLLECLRITKLFPLIGSMDDRARRSILIAAASVLLILACTESALAFMRDQIAADLAALRGSLAGLQTEAYAGSGVNEWIPLAANMILGFILPIALTMVAIPLEYLLQTGRTVFGTILEIIIGSIAVVLRILALVFGRATTVINSLYDLLIAAPLWIESLVKSSKKTSGLSQNCSQQASL